MSTATVKLWGTVIGYISMGHGERYARFEYDPAFVDFRIEPAPIQMPLDKGYIYQFTDLHPRSFHGLPGMIADSLPDKYGNKLIDVWLNQTGRKKTEFNAVDRLCYTGARGMGALEFVPVIETETTKDKNLEIRDLIDLASMAFADKETLNTKLTPDKEGNTLLDILSVGTSAGGARAKAVIAYNPETTEIRSGQLDLLPNFEHWLIKFDGVAFSGDWGLADPSGYGLLEYSYHLMAKACGIDMMESRIFSENGRNHFMTRRFDRDEEGGKKFVQTFAAIEHFDYYESGVYSYEQLLTTMRKLNMSQSAIEEQFRRIVFNVVGCNQDDHVKNFGFMMDRQGNWDITPAYDLCHAEGSDFTRFHQLSINNKTSDFILEDLKHLAKFARLPRNREKIVLEQTVDAFSTWYQKAIELDIPKALQDHVLSTLRLTW
ncbi:MAG: type II toxin-antitoxin system HipA family toxin [Rhodobacteraceae bacterium]|nr:type II toxin-antitoxin system HipA family toxin [Paracoccaceae bacterium]